MQSFHLEYFNKMFLKLVILFSVYTTFILKLSLCKQLKWSFWLWELKIHLLISQTFLTIPNKYLSVFNTIFSHLNTSKYALRILGKTNQFNFSTFICTFRDILLVLNIFCYLLIYISMYYTCTYIANQNLLKISHKCEKCNFKVHINTK